jgi:redox-sensitive bicupin YhaK (pirin superfamily)
MSTFDQGNHESGVDTIVVPRTHDLGGGFEVRRALPHKDRRMVGPFVFLDQMGPHVFHAGEGIDVRPHPHIGLATVTYLLDGQIRHRDSLGTVQDIKPGEVNWMTAGKGIVHSERTGPDVRAAGSNLFGLQCWVALPQAQEECDPAFSHTGAGDLPILDGDGATARIIAGSYFGKRSPVPVQSPMFYVDLALQPGARLTMPGVSGAGAVRGRRHARPGPRRPLRTGPAARAETGCDGHPGGDGEQGRPRDAAGRGADGWPALPDVEFRVVVVRPHRAGQGRLESAALPARSG